MAKLTIAQALELLKEAGVPHVEIVDTDDLSDYSTTAKDAEPVTKDTFLVAIDTAREKIIAPKIISAKTGEIHSSVTGKINGALRSQLSQKTGIPTADLKDLDSKEAIEKAYDFLTSKIGGDKEALIKERDELMKKHAADKTEIEKTWQGKLNEVSGKLTEKEIIAALVKDHNEAKGLPANANRATLAKQFKNHLDGIGTLKYNETTGEVEIYDKSNPDLRVYNSASKTTYAKPSDYLKPFYSDLGIWNEDNRTVNPADAMKGQRLDNYIKTGADGKLVSPLDQKLSIFAPKQTA